MPQNPTILSETIVAKSRLFTVQELQLAFSNGQKRTFERLKSHSKGAVLMVALLDDDTFLLVREYAAGLENYQLAFPKGVIESNETVFEAANRELREELGYSSRKMTLLRGLTLAPGYMSHQTQIVLAEELTPDKIDGDEPEPLEVVPWSFKKLNNLLILEDFTEARSFAALWLVERHLRDRGDKK